MNIQELNNIHSLLRQRIMLISAFQEFNMNEFRAVNVEMSHSFSEDSRDRLREIINRYNNLLKVEVYDLMLDLLRDTEYKLDELGIEIEFIHTYLMSGSARKALDYLEGQKPLPIELGQIHRAVIGPHDSAEYMDVYTDITIDKFKSSTEIKDRRKKNGDNPPF